MSISFQDLVSFIAVIYFLTASFNPSFVHNVRAKPPFFLKVAVKFFVGGGVGLLVTSISFLFSDLFEVPHLALLIGVGLYLTLRTSQRLYIEDCLSVLHWRLVDAIMTKSVSKSFYCASGFILHCKPHVTPSLMASIQPRESEKAMIMMVFNSLRLKQCNPAQKSIVLYF